MAETSYGDGGVEDDRDVRFHRVCFQRQDKNYPFSTNGISLPLLKKCAFQSNGNGMVVQQVRFLF